MSVPNSTNRISYVGNNSTVTAYPVPFLFYNNSDLQVYNVDAAGSQTLLVLDSTYTVTGEGLPEGGSIVTNPAIPITNTIVILRVVPLTQDTVYVENSEFPAKTTEEALDKLTMAVQQVNQTNAITIRLPDSAQGISPLVPVANTVIGFSGVTAPRTYTSDELVAFLNLTQTVTDSPTKTFADASQRAAAIPEFLGQVGVQIDDNSLWIGTALVAGSWQAVIGGTSYNNDAYVIVQTTTTATANGTALLAAYTAATMLTPGGSALSVNNRAVVIVPPADYDLGSASLTLATSYVDIIGMTTNRNAQYIHSATATSNAGVIRQTADNVIIQNITLRNTCGADGGSANATSSAAYFPNTDLGATRIRNVEFVSGNTTSSPYPMRLGVKYSGTYEDCNAIGLGAYGAGIVAFGLAAGDAAGTFIRCKGGNNSFGSVTGSQISGTLIDCEGGADSFAGVSGAITSTAVILNCRLTGTNFYAYSIVPAAGAVIANLIDPTGPIYFPYFPVPTGGVVQLVTGTYATYAALATTLPADNTIPQNTEGNEIFGAGVAITPKFATSKVRIRFNGIFGSQSDTTSTAAVFVGSGTSAVFAVATRTFANLGVAISFEYIHSPATTSSTTYHFRVGANSGGLKLNGNYASQLFNGVALTSVTLEEIRQ